MKFYGESLIVPRKVLPRRAEAAFRTKPNRGSAASIAANG
jgi:hypothetical protein